MMDFHKELSIKEQREMLELAIKALALSPRLTRNIKTQAELSSCIEQMAAAIWEAAYVDF
jgi:hypothetical protein